jgi:hypothetical protein
MAAGRRLPGAFDAEGGQGAGFGVVKVVLNYVVDAGTARSAADGGAQFGKVFRSAGSHDFHVAVFGVADPAMQIEFGRLALDKPAESDSLDTAANEEVKDHKFRVQRAGDGTERTVLIGPASPR